MAKEGVIDLRWWAGMGKGWAWGQKVSMRSCAGAGPSPLLVLVFFNIVSLSKNEPSKLVSPEILGRCVLHESFGIRRSIRQIMSSGESKSARYRGVW